MRLRVLAGAYAGQIRQFSTRVGMDALRSGTAEQPDVMRPRVVEPVVAVVAPVPVTGKRRRQK